MFRPASTSNNFRWITLEEFRIAADFLGRYFDDPPQSRWADERNYDDYLRINAKFVVALYFEQIKQLYALEPSTFTGDEPKPKT